MVDSHNGVGVRVLTIRRDGRMDERDGFENRYGGNLIVGSNPFPSASFRRKSGHQIYSLGVCFFL